jgi:biotin-dependent carboxylase-like uncharacterized protein
MTTELRIEIAPPGTTVQDAGRNDWLHAGVPPSGPLDATAHAAANLAVGNEPRAAALEIPFGTLHATPLGATLVSIDGDPPVALAPGQHLVVPPHARAVRYLAVAGGFAVPAILGSRATLVLAGLGGFQGRALRSGDVVPIAELEGGAADSRKPAPIAMPTVVDPPDPAILRVSIGPHLARMPPDALAELTSATWLVSPRSDRVGVRLEGSVIARSGDDRAPPCPMIRGAIQITTDGTPIVLGPDHPVTGGYPVLAVLGRTSQAVLARLRPRRALRFVTD